MVLTHVGYDIDIIQLITNLIPNKTNDAKPYIENTFQQGSE
jgi:hypothetical protein